MILFVMQQTAGRAAKRHRSFLQRFLTNILRLWVLVLVGTIGYMLVEHWSFLGSLFFSVITLTTVGYGDIHPLDQSGEVYTIMLILVGTGYVLYVLSDMVQLFLE